MNEEENDDRTRRYTAIPGRYQLVSGRMYLGGNAVRRLPGRYGRETLASFHCPGRYIPQLQSVILHHKIFSCSFIVQPEVKKTITSSLVQVRR